MQSHQSRQALEASKHNPALYVGALRALWALAKGDFSRLGTVNEDYQGAVDAIVEKIRDVEQVVAREREWCMRFLASKKRSYVEDDGTWSQSGINRHIDQWIEEIRARP